MAQTFRLMTRGNAFFRGHNFYQRSTPTLIPSTTRHSNVHTIFQRASSCRSYDSSRYITIGRSKHAGKAPEWSRAQAPRQSITLASPSSADTCRNFSNASIRLEASKKRVENSPRTDQLIETASKAAEGTKPKPVPEILKRITPPVLHENIYTLPNFLTTTRIITAPCISYALLHSQPVLAFGLFAYSSITDLVDGWLARRYKSGTVLGSILDPFADKLLMTLTTISLYSIGTFPWWITLIILGRDAGLLLSALYFRWISLPPPKTMTRYWDFSLPSAEVRPTEISKINTLLQFLLVADAVLLPVLPVSLVESWNLWGIFEGWMGLVAGTTIWSGLSYVFTKDAIRFIGQDNKKK